MESFATQRESGYGLRQSVIVAAFNHLQHEGNGAEDVVAEAEASSDGGGDPKGPKQKVLSETAKVGGALADVVENVAEKGTDGTLKAGELPVNWGKVSKIASKGGNLLGVVSVVDAAFDLYDKPSWGGLGKVIYETAGFIAIKNPYVLGAKVFVDITGISDWTFSKF